MENYIIVILATAALFGAIIIQLAAKPKFAGRVTGTFIVLAVLGGLVFYGCGFAWSIKNIPLAVIRALLGVCGMFVAKMDYASVSVVPLFQTIPAQLIFWLVHLFALYATASTAITTVGAEALRKLRLWMARRGELNLIYGVNVDSREFGKELMTQKHSSVMYVDEKPDSSLAAVIQKMGCVLRSDDLAVQADARFLRSVGVRAGHRKITVYAISKDATANLRFAKRCLSSLRQCEVAAEQTSLVLLGQDNETVRSLQVTENKYGYGYVTIYQESEMTARLMIQKYPPCDGIEFDETGRATEDFEALVVGFGQTGQAVLRHLIMNGQFVGSTFRAAVFAPDCQSVNGYFSRGLEQVLKNYDIMFCPFDARSREMYDYILERRKTLKYVAVCTGSEQTNQEIAVELAAYFAHLEMDIPICQCSRRGVKRMDQDGTVISYHKLYQSGIIATGALDRMAMIINHHYHIGTEKTALEEWMVCDYFSRMSCRASADFMPAVLRAAGRTTEQAMTGPWDFSEEKLEVLSHMEHLRWCAFHYCMGFSPMDGEEYAVRTEIYQRQLAADGKASIRVGKNMKQRTHACLIGWEKLDELSAYETKITGRKIDYKALDQENILVIPELLQAKKKFEEAE